MDFKLIFLEGAVRMQIENGENVMYVDLAPNDIEQLINQLSNIRRHLNPEVPRTLPEDHHKGEVDPLWQVHIVPMTEADKILFLRSAGMGWIASVLHENEAHSLAAALMARQQLPPSPTLTRQ